jgi:hypothetical protein
MKFINNSIIPVTSVGNGTTVQAELHTNDFIQTDHSLKTLVLQSPRLLTQHLQMMLILRRAVARILFL